MAGRRAGGRCERNERSWRRHGSASTCTDMYVYVDVYVMYRVSDTRLAPSPHPTSHTITHTSAAFKWETLPRLLQLIMHGLFSGFPPVHLGKYKHLQERATNIIHCLAFQVDSGPDKSTAAGRAGLRRVGPISPAGFKMCSAAIREYALFTTNRATDSAKYVMFQ